jgi:hypothetical protein
MRPLVPMRLRVGSGRMTAQREDSHSVHTPVAGDPACIDCIAHKCGERHIDRHVTIGIRHSFARKHHFHQRSDTPGSTQGNWTTRWQPTTPRIPKQIVDDVELRFYYCFRTLSHPPPPYHRCIKERNSQDHARKMSTLVSRHFLMLKSCAPISNHVPGFW